MLFENPGKNVDLFEVIDLSHIPEVNRVLAEKLEDIGRGELGKCLEEYKLKRDNYYKEMFEKVGRQDQGLPLYWFELTLYEGLNWRITSMESFNPQYAHPYGVLPWDVIQEIAGSVVDPDRIITREAIHSDSLNKNVTVRWVRYSSEFIFGTVIEVTSPGTQAGDGAVTDHTRLEEDMMVYNLFYDNMRKYPDQTRDYLYEFFSKKLPALLVNQKGSQNLEAEK